MIFVSASNDFRLESIQSTFRYGLEVILIPAKLGNVVFYLDALLELPFQDIGLIHEQNLFPGCHPLHHR